MRCKLLSYMAFFAQPVSAASPGAMQIGWWRRLKYVQKIESYLRELVR